MRWLGRILFYGRVRRMKRIQHAAALLADGRMDEAEQLLDSARSTVWVEDLAIYHFVRGKLLMERGDLEGALLHLHTALGLGLERPSVKLNLAVLLVRRCQLDRALAMLDDVDLSDDPAVLEQSRVMRSVIEKTRQGQPLAEISRRAERFRKKHLKGSRESPEATVSALERRLRSRLSRSDREDASLLLGQILVESRDGVWLAGLEPRDHLVLVGGVLHSPATMIDRLLEGEDDRILLPSQEPG